MNDQIRQYSQPVHDSSEQHEYCRTHCKECHARAVEVVAELHERLCVLAFFGSISPQVRVASEEEKQRQSIEDRIDLHVHGEAVQCRAEHEARGGVRALVEALVDVALVEVAQCQYDEQCHHGLGVAARAHVDGDGVQQPQCHALAHVIGGIIRGPRENVLEQGTDQQISYHK